MQVRMLDPAIYERNVKFWERAWGGVKTPYTQMPDLPYLQQIPTSLQQAPGKRVLDLGCGSGWLAIFLARLGFEVTGVDIAPHALELAKTWADQEGLSINFLVADIADMPFEPGSFDAVVGNSIFEHLTYDLAKTTIDALHELLLPEGLLFGCFDKVGTGPGEYETLEDGTHVYTDKGRSGMLLRYFSDEELRGMFTQWEILSMESIESGSRILWTKK